MELPPPKELERRGRLIAALDAVLEPDLALRYFDFDDAWARGQRMFSVRSGEGDHAFAWFGAAGAVVRGKHSERKAVPDAKLFAGLPKTLQGAHTEPAFQLDGDSFATWAPKGAATWLSATNPLRGGMGDVLAVLDGDPKTFARYAREHHDVKLDVAVLGSIYAGAALTPKRIAALLGTAGKQVKRAASSNDDVSGDAEFKVVRDGDTTKLVVGGKVQLHATRAGLYYEVIEGVRAALRAAGAMKS